MPETLDFVQACSFNWHIPITWLEYSSVGDNHLRIVNHNSAARNGEPFFDLFTAIVPRRRDGTAGLRPLPMPGSRICTAELKIHLSDRYLRRILGWDSYYYSAIGLRYDEKRRVDAQRKYPPNHGVINIHPLFDLGISSNDVLNFWKNQTFDLQLDPEKGMGNCDLCFLKSADRIKQIIFERPETANFWIDLEESPRDRKSYFRSDRPSYRELRDKALAGDLGFEKEDTFINDCSCTE